MILIKRLLFNVDDLSNNHGDQLSTLNSDLFKKLFGNDYNRSNISLILDPVTYCQPNIVCCT